MNRVNNTEMLVLGSYDRHLVLLEIPDAYGGTTLEWTPQSARIMAKGMLRVARKLERRRRRERWRAWLAGLGLLACFVLAGSCGDGPNECIEGDRGLVVCEQGRIEQ